MLILYLIQGNKVLLLLQTGYTCNLHSFFLQNYLISNKKFLSQNQTFSKFLIKFRGSFATLRIFDLNVNLFYFSSPKRILLQNFSLLLNRLFFFLYCIDLPSLNLLHKHTKKRPKTLGVYTTLLSWL